MRDRARKRPQIAHFSRGVIYIVILSAQVFGFSVDWLLCWWR
jgi:hypothetical protein